MADKVDQIMPYYWHQHEFHTLAEKAGNALFDLQNKVQQIYSTPDKKDDDFWREIYGLRIEIGRIERNIQLLLGYKDGVFSNIQLEENRRISSVNTCGK